MMAKKAKKAKAQKAIDVSLSIFQLKITLEDIDPPVWRRIQTHDCSLADLHEIIQSCMGWIDDHMHAFEIDDEEYADFSRGVDSYQFSDSRTVRLSELVEQGELSFIYEYDFGDSWRHVIEIESTLLPEDNVRYPRCVDGQRACPPEDSGGPWAYADFLEVVQNPDHEDYEERMECVGGEFDPEEFRLDLVNAELLHVRRWLGQEPGSHAPAVCFAPGDRIRVKHGTVHSQYPDIPLGGWVGTVTRIVWVFPVCYEVLWTEETLAKVHPVYLKRCRRDETQPETHWLDEGEMELDSAESPAEIEHPTNLVQTPLSDDNQEDRIRMVFGLTSDDPLPTPGEETEQKYLDYLKTHMAFPFDAIYWSDLAVDSPGSKDVVVVGFASQLPIDLTTGLLCEIRRGEASEQVPLERIQLEDDGVHERYVEDYRYWRWDAQVFAHADCYDGEVDDEEYWDDEEDGEPDDEEYEDEEYDAEEYEDDDLDDEDDEGPDVANPRGDDDSVPQPFRHPGPQVGRNDPCPCGSGKKFKKCCLRKTGDGAVE